MLRGPDPPLLGTWRGPYCWICNRDFVSVAGVTTAVANEHHVVPRSLGGTNGPTVSLCSEHHDLMHAVAEQLVRDTPIAQVMPLLQGLAPPMQQRLLYLADVIIRATRAFADDVNKPYLLQCTLPARTGRQLTALANNLGTSVPKALIVLIDASYRHQFPGVSQ